MVCIFSDTLKSITASCFFYADLWPVQMLL
jgi:hypothetical protein